MGQLISDFFTSFDLEKKTTLEGYIKIHGPKPNYPSPLEPER